MSDLDTAPAVSPDLSAESEPVLEAVALEQASPAPVLITEQQVRFATAAAAAVPALPSTTHWWTRSRRSVVAAFSVSRTAEEDSRPPRRHYPPRNDFLEDSRMKREMYRL
jgi:hypothetical protein